MTKEEIAKKAYETFAAYVMESSAVLALITEEAVYNLLLDAVTGATREEITDMARELAASMVTNITEGTAQGLAEAIASGLERGLGFEKLGDEIFEMVGLNKQQVQQVESLKEQLASEGKSDAEIAKAVESLTEELQTKRAELIATTEMNRAVSLGEDEVMRNRGAKYKVWITVGDDAVSDDCQANEADGPIPVEDSFSGGVDVPPQHPGCRCAVSYITDDSLLDGATARAEARAEKTAQAKGGEEEE